MAGAPRSMTLREILERYRAGAKTEREKGGYFERLVKVWLENAPTQRGQFSRVLTFAEWAKERDEDTRDLGIDLCAELADEQGSWCAVQCKFYRAGHRIQRADIDSFFTASGKRPFVRRIIVDTTDAQWGDNAETALQNQTAPTIRIGLTDLDESGLDWAAFASEEIVRLAPKKQPMPHQVEAIDAVKAGLESADRGKLIMACGTGKTFTALKIAEELAGQGGRVLYLVPSLALMSQTVREWSIDSAIPLRSFAVCSDSQVGVRKAKNDDLADIDVHDLEIPATTLANAIGAKARVADAERMTVVFSTYQSIQVLSEAQARHGLPEFDLIVCDEAHRTTGVTLQGEDESNFQRVHDQSFIKGKKRIYMTATPRIYGDAVQQAAKEADAALSSMDDESKYGQTLFTRNFSWAVQRGLLTDYKVIVLAVDEAAISASVQRRLSDADSQLILDDATKIVGCYRALLKADLAEDVAGDHSPMRKALAFTRDIRSSKLFSREFANVVGEWRESWEAENPDAPLPELTCEADHVDGSFNATARNQRLAWLKNNEGGAERCRILSNARCLTEGVDVPALDAIMFLHPRKSQIDVVQAVGRVMRKAEGKRLGYVILPVGVPAGVPPEEALNNNEKYRVVWQILNALRAHDDRLDATINKIALDVHPGSRIEVIAVTNTLPQRANPRTGNLGIGQGGGAGDLDPGEERTGARVPEQLAFQFDEFAKAILARIVKKCGRRTYWEDWAKDVAEIAKAHITRLTAVVQRAGSAEKAAFDAFLAEIRDDLNDEISVDDAIEMLAQHMITRPVFDAIFDDYQFATQNPVSQALQGVLNVLDNQHLEREAQSLERFYDSVRMRAAGIEDAAAKQRIVKDLYEQFFRSAFPSTAERLGIVYTPVEVVDFIIKSVGEVLESEFGQTLGNEGVHIIDPFAGTGTFITRLLQSGLITPNDGSEIHANEIALLAYYIAAINIEAVYHQLSVGEYTPFPGICLTDTFQLYEHDDLVSELMADNSSRRARQRQLPIRVIIGNPPYSVGQRSENDNAANVDYPNLDERIRITYGDRSEATLQKTLYDSYIRAIRWGSDKLGDRGVMAIITNANWVEANAFDGLRKCLVEDYSSLYVFHLRGNARTSGERRRREKDNVFGQGSRAPVAISVLVKNPNASERGQIWFHDIGDYLSREEKLARIDAFGAIGGITAANGWRRLEPDEHGDWLRHRDPGFERYYPMGDRDAESLFSDYSLGVSSNRDAWVVNSSDASILESMKVAIDFYNSERGRLHAASDDERRNLGAFLKKDTKKVSWSSGLHQKIQRNLVAQLNRAHLRPCLYRPFTKQWMYFDPLFNDRQGRIPTFFPKSDTHNRLLAVSSGGGRKGFSALMMDCIPSLHTVDLDGGQYFPLRFWRVEEADEGDLFPREHAASLIEQDGISEVGLAHVRAAYPNENITKEDVFYYAYGLLHSEDYRERYADNLSRVLPRIPCVRTPQDFWAFVQAGRELGDLHVNYEQAAPYGVTIREGDLRLANIPDPTTFYRVEKMKFGGVRNATDKSIVHYNANITLENIPLDAYDYVVNGKSALEWVMERQSVKTDKDSGIVNDANRYAIETVGDPAYPLTLFQRVITVSLETLRIIGRLPELDIPEPQQDGQSQPNPEGVAF